MEKKSPSTRSIGAAIVIAVLLLLGVYVCGYYGLGERNVRPPRRAGGDEYIVRSYSHPWLAIIFAPASRMESAIRGQTVYTGINKPP